MNKKINILFLVLLIVLACEPALTDDPIPFVAFDDIIVDISFSNYVALNRNQGFLEITDGQAGVRGIILYRQSQNVYFAYEKNCSYQPNSACATVDIHASGLFMSDFCCGSNFNFSDGTPMSGPAWRPLRKYRVEQDGSQLTITDDVVMPI